MSVREAKHYPQNALKGNTEADPITDQEASTLDELFRERVRRNPEKVAYSQYDKALFSCGEHFIGKKDRTVPCGFRPYKASAPVQAFPC